MEKVDVIVAFAFTKHGEANKVIARESVLKSKEYNAPVFTQQDIANYFFQENNTFVPYIDPQKVHLAQEDDSYLSTLGIAKALKHESRVYNWKRIYLLAAPCHEWRCTRDLKKLGFIILKDDYLKKAYHFKFWYNKNDSQIWVHNQYTWWAREIILRLLPWKLYSKFTS